MNVIEIHLILNHIPIIGMAFVGLYLFIAMLCKKLFMQKVSLWLLCGLAILTVAVYFSGLGAETPVKNLPGVSNAYLQLHEKVARIATVTVCATGGVTLLGLVFLRKGEQEFKYFVRGIFAMTLLSNALFILTGYLGGQVTHSEIRSSLAEGLSTRTITLGVVAIMAVIVIAMIVPLLLHSYQVFKKAEQITADRTVEWRGGQNPWDEQERVTAINPSWGRAAQQERAWSSIPGDLREQQYRPLIEENTRPMPKVSPRSKRLAGKKGLVIALGLTGAVILLGGLGFALLHLLLKPPLPLQIVADIPLSGSPNRFDYQYLDPNTRLLYLTHSASNMVTIFDTVSGKVVADIPGIKDPHDVAVASDLGRVFVTSATDNLVAVVDARSHAIVARIPVGEAPDGLIYDPADQKLFVADEAGQNEAVIDARSERRIAEIPLGGDAGDVEYDALSHHVVAIVATLDQLVTIDPVSDRVIARAALVGCQTAQDLVLDESQRLAFVDCIDNATLVMVDLQSMRVLSTQSTGKSPDLMALDTGWHYLYTAGESGVVSVFDVRGRTLRKLNEGYVAPGAHTVAVDQETHDIYLPLQNVNGRPILRIALFHP